MSWHLAIALAYVTVCRALHTHFRSSHCLVIIHYKLRLPKAPFTLEIFISKVK